MNMDLSTLISVIDTLTEAVVRWSSVKKVFLKIPQNSQENTCARYKSLFFNKVVGLSLHLYEKGNSDTDIFL